MVFKRSRLKARQSWTPPKATPYTAFRGAACMDLGPTVASPIPKERPRKDPAFKAWLIENVKTCQHCGREATDPSHHNEPGKGAVSLKPFDDSLCMLCWECHRGAFHMDFKLPSLTVDATRRKVARVGKRNRELYRVALEGSETWLKEVE